MTRARLTALAPSLGLEAREGPITPADLRDATAVFLTSSLRVTAVGTAMTRPSSPVDSRITVIARALAAGDWS